ncbi:MAG: HAD-IIB family hydrolase [Candidatus Shapirobacteria bacterium]
MIIDNPKSILAFDLDGTITPRNQFEIHPKGLSQLLNDLSNQGHFFIPVTGKPVAYAAKIFSANNLIDRGIIAENAGVYRKPNSQKIEIYGPSIKEMYALRDKLGIGMEKVNVTDIFIDQKKYEVAVDPDDVSILTIFTDPTYVTHRWKFNHSIEAELLVEKINNIITSNNWQNTLSVLPPFPDRAIQIIRKDPISGHSIDKSSIIFALNAIYPNIDTIPIAMFGDGHNDIPAMKPDKVIPITFTNAHSDVLTYVKSKNGYISPHNAPEDLGVPDGLLWLAKNNFFKEDTNAVHHLITRYFPSLVG